MTSSDSLLSWSPASTDERLSTRPTVTSAAKQDQAVASSSTSSRLRMASGVVQVVPAAAPAPLLIHHGDRRTDFMEPPTYDSYGGVRTAATLVSLILLILIGILYRERLYVGRKCRDLIVPVRPVGRPPSGGGGQSPHQDGAVEPPGSSSSPGLAVESPLGEGGDPFVVQTTDVESLVETI